MKELYGKFAKGLKRHSQKLRAVVVAMAMIFIAAPFYGQTWNLVGIDDLTSTDVFMIVDTAGGNAMSNDNGTTSAPACVSIAFNDDYSQVTTATIPDNVKWNISGNSTDGFTFYPNGTTETWLYCNTTAASGSNNNMRVGTGDRKLFLLHEENHLKTNDSNTTRYIGAYNSSDWRGYTSVSSNIAATRIAFYKYTEDANAVDDPTFSPVAGTYTNSVEVTLACETDEATIYYTLDGTDPTAESTEYTAAITITTTTTVKAIAIKNGYSSDIVSATYTITDMEIVATPTISPNGGDFDAPQEITLACETAAASIYYTIDGTEPTAESTLYAAPFTLSASATVKAIAIKDGMTNSAVASAEFTMPVFLENLLAVYSTAANDQYRVTGDVTFVFRSGRYMFVKDATAGVVIYDNSTSVITTEYTEGDVISGGISGKTSIYKGLYELVPSANTAASTENTGAVAPTVVTVRQMTTANDYMSQLVKLENVTITAISGSNITISDGDTTTVIYDKLNVITESDYAVDDVITVTGLVSMYNTHQLWPRTAADIVEQETVEAPTFTPEAGTYTSSVEVTLACATADATVYYTLNDSDSQVEYTAPLTFTETTTIYAFAEKNSIRSTVVSATYTITTQEVVATPTISPEGGNFESTQEVTLACETAEASIFYTLDGTDPTAESTLYSAPFTLDATTIVKAIAVKEGMLNSAIAEATFTKVEPVTTVSYTRIASLSQLQDGDQVIIASRYDDDATHYYVAPTALRTVTSTNIKIYGVATTASSTDEGYVIETSTDTVIWTLKISDGSYMFVNASGDTLGWNSGANWAYNQNVAWNIEEVTSSETSFVQSYTAFKIANAADAARAISLRNNDDHWFAPYSYSANVSNAQYNFAIDLFVDLGDHAPLVATPTFSLPAGNYTSEQTVEIACATEGATIRYTLDGTDPTEESTEYTAALTITEPTTVKAKAFKQDCIASGIAEAFYNVVTTPAIMVDPESLSFSDVNEALTVTVSSLNLTADITVAVTENFTVSAETITMNTDSVITVTFVGDAVTNGTLTLTSGETVATVALVANPPVASEGCYYPVADALTDWSGDYLITFSELASETINALSGIHQNNYGLYENVYEYYADGVIASNLTTESCKVTIAATENGYSMYLNRVGFLGINSDANKLYSYTEFTAERDEWTIAASDNGVVTITSNKYPNRQLQWNAGTPRFACYTGGQTAVTLYKLGPIPAVATPVFTPAAGYYEEAQNVTITCSTEGATIYYTTDGTEPTSASTQYTAAIEVSENTTIKAIAVLGDDVSFAATARYTFPIFVENIAALYALENTDGNYKLTGDVTFVFRKDRNMYIKDATGGLLIYDQNNKITTEYTEGDVITGGISGTISIYHGLLEYVPVLNTAASTQNTGAVEPTVITVEQLLTNNYVSQLVKVENVAIATGTTYVTGDAGDNLTFAQNGNEAILRNNFKTLDMTIEDGANWDIVGFASINDENIQIYPRSNDDVSIVTSVEDLALEIAIYPNPTSGIVNIVTNGNAQRIEVANVEGQVVSNENVSSDVVAVSLEGQPAGMYFVRIYTANEVIVRKITKF